MKSIVLFNVVALLCFCGGCMSVEKASVKADRAIYEAIAPEYRAYVEEDNSLTVLQKTMRLDTVHKWNYMLAIKEGMDPHELFGRSVPE